MARRRTFRRAFVPPVEAVEGGWRINLDAEERDLLVRLMSELESLLGGPDDSALLARLFPAAYEDDAEKEAEYQRLMREELVASRLGALNAVRAVLEPGGPEVLEESQTIAFMQSINAIRLVLGTMLGIDDDDSQYSDADAAADDDQADPEHSAEFQLYDFLSWLLEWTVRALSPD